MTSKRIFITEIGSLSCLGMGFEQIAQGMKNPPVCTSVKDFEFHQFPSEVPVHLVNGFDPVEVLGKKGLRNKDNSTKMLLGALDSGLKTIMETTEESSRPGLCIGTAFGSVQSIGDFLSDSIVNGVNNVNPQAFANTVINSPTGNANIRYVAKNLSATIATGFNAGIDALIYAFDYMQSGYINSIVAGGLEEVSYYSLLGLQRAGVLSVSGNARPFASDADGCIMGEGCALFLMETEDSMNARGAKPIAEILSVSSGFDPEAAQSGASDGQVGAYVIKDACKQAGIEPSMVSFVASGANGNLITDHLESGAIVNSLGTSVPVTAYKAIIGECYGASGALVTACALSDMKNGRLTGTGSEYSSVDSISLVKRTQQKNSDIALITSFSCEGNCSAIVIKNC